VSPEADLDAMDEKEESTDCQIMNRYTLATQHKTDHYTERHMFTSDRPPLWSSSLTSWLQTQRSRFRFPTLPPSSSGFGTGSTQPL
jgi:hypothetical protein